MPIQSLFEPEVCAVEGAVVQFNDQLTTRTGPGGVGLPDVDIAIRRRVVAEAAAAGCYCFGQVAGGVARVAGYWS